MSPSRFLTSLLTCSIVGLAFSSASCVSSVISVYISTDTDGVRRLEPVAGQQLVTFPPSTRAVYCVAEISNGREDATIEGLMHQESEIPTGGGEEVSDRDIIVVSLSERAPVGAQQKVVMALTPKNAKGDDDQKEPLKGGQYRCEFALRTQPTPPDRKPVWDGIAQFRIEATLCPSAQIFTGQDCTAYRDRTEPCPADGSRSEKQATSPSCMCLEGLWQCQ